MFSESSKKIPVKFPAENDAETAGENAAVPETPASRPQDEGVPTAGEPPQPARPGPREQPADQALKEQLAKLQVERDELYRTLIRRQADFENFRKRVERERREDGDRAVARLVGDLLPVLDAFERALDTARALNHESAVEFRRGFDLLYRQLVDVLEKTYKLERIVAVGRRFDPHEHHAVERVETAEHPDGTVLEELQPGYKLRGQVLRPSMVRVAVRSASAISAEKPASETGVN